MPRVLEVLCIASLAASNWLVVSCNRQYPLQTIRIGEYALRDRAMSEPLPKLETSLGPPYAALVVANIGLNHNGDVESVEILDSPGEPTSRSFRKALFRWKFRPSTLKGEPVRVEGKLTFYLLADEKGVSILSPAEAMDHPEKEKFIHLNQGTQK